jgi:hypothetical protein
VTGMCHAYGARNSYRHAGRPSPGLGLVLSRLRRCDSRAVDLKRRGHRSLSSAYQTERGQRENSGITGDDVTGLGSFYGSKKCRAD